MKTGKRKMVGPPEGGTPTRYWLRRAVLENSKAPEDWRTPGRSARYGDARFSAVGDPDTSRTQLLLVDVQLVLRGVQVEVFTESLVKCRIDGLVTFQLWRLPDFDRRNRQPNARIPFFGPRQARWDHECVVAILFRRNAGKYGLVVVTRSITFQATDRIAAPIHHFLA